MVECRSHIAVIPARGGSKRLPRKNIVDFVGKPMIAWTIAAALEAGVFDRVIVSTEDEEIASCARNHGAEVPFLRTTAYDEYSPTSAVTLAVLEQCRHHLGEEYHTVTQLMPNCPLRDVADIRGAVAAFETVNANFQLSCFRFGWMNPWWAMQLDEGGHGKNLFHQTLNQRSQDLPPLYCPTGAIWIARTKSLKDAGTFYGPKHRFEILPLFSAIDIDDFDDLAFAKAAYLIKHQSC